MRRFVASLLFAAAATGCGPPPGGEVPKQPEAPPGVAAPVGPQATIAVDPAVMRTCVAPIVATVNWDASPLGITDVNILAAGPDTPTPALFAMVGSPGTIQTGPWTVAGTTFTLTDRESRVLATVKVKSEPC